MSDTVVSPAGALKAALAWVVLVTGLVLAGMAPILGVLAASVVAVDVAYYHHHGDGLPTPSLGSS